MLGCSGEDMQLTFYGEDAGAKDCYASHSDGC
jgi:hypothetical protein